MRLSDAEVVVGEGGNRDYSTAWDSVIWIDFTDLPIHNLYIGLSVEVSMGDSIASDIGKTDISVKIKAAK